MILAPGWTCDPALAALFTPARSEVGRYELCTTPEPMDAIAARERDGGVHLTNPEVLDAREAFGAAGSYNRAALARLYVGTPLRVARGWADRVDRFESVTVLSPYPNPSLTGLQPGTMVIRLVLRKL